MSLLDQMFVVSLTRSICVSLIVINSFDCLLFNHNWILLWIILSTHDSIIGQEIVTDAPLDQQNIFFLYFSYLSLVLPQIFVVLWHFLMFRFEARAVVTIYWRFSLPVKLVWLSFSVGSFISWGWWHWFIKYLPENSFQIHVQTIVFGVLSSFLERG